MSYEGRSPMNDVVRSVLVGAAMISPSLLQACKNGETTPPIVPDHTNDADAATTMNADSGVDPTTTTDPTTAPTTDPTTAPTNTAAPSTTVVRPRPSVDPTMMPTRGFSGAARGRA